MGDYVFKIDSGSDLTFMNKEDCYELGYMLSECKERTYTDTDTHNQIARIYVKKFNIRIGDYDIKKVPIAFSSKPIQMYLLGRAKIFNSVDICFHSKSKNTLIVTPDKK